MDKLEITYHLSNGADGGYRAEAFSDEAEAVEAAERLGTNWRVSDVRFKGDDGLAEVARAAYYNVRDDLEYQHHIGREGSEQYNQHPDGCFYCGSPSHHSGDCPDREGPRSRFCAATRQRPY